MKGVNLRGRLPHSLDEGRPPSIDPSMSRSEHSVEGTQAPYYSLELPPKQPSTLDERVAEILDEIRRLRREEAYYETLTKGVLLRIMPMLCSMRRDYTIL